MDWKMARVVPVHKKDRRDCPANYRPISITSVSCKVLEHILHSSIMVYLDREGLLGCDQYGFVEEVLAISLALT